MIEIMDDPMVNSIENIWLYERNLNCLISCHPYSMFQVWHNDLWSEFCSGHQVIAALRKDTYAVTEHSKGNFECTFGERLSVKKCLLFERKPITKVRS